METIERITIRCFVIGMVAILLWWLMYISGDWIYNIHSKWFDITKEQFAILHYAGMMFAKTCIFIFFLAPYIACKWAKK